LSPRLYQRLYALFAVAVVTAAQSPDALTREFGATVRPFVRAYCLGCHSGAKAAAEFDLTRYAAIEDVVRDHPRWTLVMEKLANGDMPPKGMKQPSDTERKAVIGWVEELRKNEARKNAGDPGPVLIRRLSNAEFNNTIRDITGADIRPAREFPVDPSNPEGFDNSGESLAMTPALLTKYLQAAREISTHLVLKPKGIAFAVHPMLAESDREKYTIQRIVAFYERQPTRYADYFQAAWNYRHRAAAGQADLTLDAVAKAAKVSPKYLPMVWELLESNEANVGPLAKLRLMWRMMPRPEHKQPELVREAAVKMDAYVTRIRQLTARQFASPMIKGLSGTSQPLMNWKLRAFAAHRRDFDRQALQVEGEPPTPIPANASMEFFVRGNGQDTIAARNAVLAIRARHGEADLMVPAGERARYEDAMARFANVFPDAFYIKERGRFYPDDSEDKGRLLSAGFHNVMGYFRDDTALQELILDEAGKRELEELWLEFDTIADHTIRTYTQFFFNQSGEIDGRGRESGSFRPGDVITTEKIIFDVRQQYLAKAETEANPVALQAITEHFARVNAAIRLVERTRAESEPSHLDGMLAFASRAFRRPLQARERAEILTHYRESRDKAGLSHDEAMRELVVLVLMSPAFCYRADGVEISAAPAVSPVKPAAARGRPTAAPRMTPLSPYALASRLSYFLWASAPDEELLAQAASGDLTKPDVLRAQVNRMLRDKRAAALATEFATNWLMVRRFEDHQGVDRQRFPAFTNDLRSAMFEEPVRFIDDIIRNDRSALDMLYGKHTFVNRTLARHYEMENVRAREGEWVKVEDATRVGRGGLLPMAVFLTVNSPGLRTSPVKRGYWVARRLLGEVIPPPPPTVPELPGDESKSSLPLRQLLARHRENAACAGCHARFDSFGLSFENYGPTGERRKSDLAGRAVDTSAEFPNGMQGTGLDDLRGYIRKHREQDFVSTLTRKLLVYALGRSLLLPDEPLLDTMRGRFTASGHKVSALVEAVVTSPQFLNQRAHVDVSARTE